MNIWLDDIRDPHTENYQRTHGAKGNEVWVKTVPEALEVLKSNKGRVKSISFDHDLGVGNIDGIELAKWFEEQAYYGTYPRVSWRVHSDNPVGAKNIRDAMKSADRFWSRRASNNSSISYFRVKRFQMEKQADSCSEISETMKYVKCRAEKMEKEEGYPVDKAFATAWSIACGPKRQKGGLDDAEEHCKRKPSGYFTNKVKSKKADKEQPMSKTISADEYVLLLKEAEEKESYAKGEKGKKQQEAYFKKNPKAKEEWEKQIKENEGVVTAAGVETIGKGKNGYVAIWSKGQRGANRVHVKADSKYEAQQQATQYFQSKTRKKVKGWDLAIELAELDGAQQTITLQAGLLDQWASLDERFLKEAEDKESENKEARHPKGPMSEKEKEKLFEDNPKFKEMNDEYGDVVKKKKESSLSEKWAELDKDAGCEKLPNEAMQKNCEEKKKEGEANKDKEEAKKEASCACGKPSCNCTTCAVERRNLYASWGLTALEAHELLAEEELDAYLDEMFAEELEGTGNDMANNPDFQGLPGKTKGGYKPVKDMGNKWDPNVNKEDRKGGNDGNKGRNHTYVDYGSAKKNKKYHDEYMESGKHPYSKMHDSDEDVKKHRREKNWPAEYKRRKELAKEKRQEGNKAHTRKKCPAIYQTEDGKVKGGKKPVPCSWTK